MAMVYLIYFNQSYKVRPAHRATINRGGDAMPLQFDAGASASAAVP